MIIRPVNRFREEVLSEEEIRSLFYSCPDLKTGYKDVVMDILCLYTELARSNLPAFTQAVNVVYQAMYNSVYHPFAMKLIDSPDSWEAEHNEIVKIYQEFHK